MTTKITITFECPAFYDLYMTSHTHGWTYLAPFLWDEETFTLRFAVLVDGISVDIESCQVKNTLRVTLCSRMKLSIPRLNAIKKMVRRSLGLDIKTHFLLEKAEQAGPEYANLVRKGAGRPLRSPTLWEDAAKTLFTTNCSWSLTKKMCESICSERFVRSAPSGAYPFPLPQTIAGYSTAQLKASIPVGYRADYLKALAGRFSTDPYLNNLETDGYDYGSADEIVRRLKGFADYACAHLLILAGYYDKIPIDTTVVSFLKKNYRVRKPQSFVARHYRKWGSDRWRGYKLDRMITKQNWIGN